MPTPFVIFPTDAHWRIASPGATDDVRVDRDAPAAGLAAAVAAGLRGRGYQGEGTLLALPAAWCLAAPISTADLPRQDRAAMGFRLEEKLPLAAEHFTADFVPSSHDQALGVCVQNDKVRPLIEALEAAGVVVQSVTPAAILAVQTLAIPPAAGASLVVWREGDHVNLVTLERGAPTSWCLARADAADLAWQLDVALLRLPGPFQAVACDVPGDLLPALDGLTERPGDTIEAAVTRAAPAVLAGGLAPWVELRRGPMAIHDKLRVIRRPLNAACAAAAACLLVAAAVFVYRGFAYDRLAQSLERETAEQFKAEFPDWPVPPNVRTVVESERRKLAEAGSSALPPEAQESALRVLHGLLAHLPGDPKLSFDHLTFNDTSFELTGRAKSNEDVDPLVAAAKSAGIETPPPQMRRTAEGQWGFTVRGSKPTKPAPVAAGGRE